MCNRTCFTLGGYWTSLVVHSCKKGVHTNLLLSILVLIMLTRINYRRVTDRDWYCIDLRKGSFQCTDDKGSRRLRRPGEKEARRGTGRTGSRGRNGKPVNIARPRAEGRGRPVHVPRPTWSSPKRNRVERRREERRGREPM